MVDITVIIPCYNCSKWVEKCLEALNNQTYKSFEAICIDDCSTDNTGIVLQSMQNKVFYDLRIINNQVNSGPAESRNAGIREARGQYLAFCDSDDWYDKTYLEDMFSTLQEENADLVMCEYRKIYESNGKYTDMHYLVNFDGNQEDLMAYSKSAMCLLMYKKELTKDLEVPDLRNGEDIAYVPCIESRAESIAVVKKVLYNYMMRQGSASKTPSSSVYKSLVKAFDFLKANFVKESPEVIEYIGVKTILYGAVLNAYKAKENEDHIIGIISDFENKYPK